MDSYDSVTGFPNTFGTQEVPVQEAAPQPDQPMADHPYGLNLGPDGNTVQVPITTYQGMLQVNSNLTDNNAFLSNQVTQLMEAVRVLTSRIPSDKPGQSDSEFKVPSVKAPSFDGKCRHKNAQEAQTIIDDYLHQCARDARLYGFLADGQTSSKKNHRTYVDWISTGLTGPALQKWRQIPQPQQHGMTFETFSLWIRREFTSPLSTQQAIVALLKLKQTGPCSTFSQHFNDLLESLKSNQINLPTLFLCYLYRLGLKDHLQSDEDLFRINDQLSKLQDEAERKDDFFFRQYKEKGKSSNQPSKGRPPQRDTNPGPKVDPMQLDNISGQPLARLTEAEKATYRANGWCTYCRSKEHSYPQCTAPGKRRQTTGKEGHLHNAEEDDDDETTIEETHGHYSQSTSTNDA